MTIPNEEEQLDNIKCKIVSKSCAFGIFFYIFSMNLFSKAIVGIIICIINSFILKCDSIKCLLFVCDLNFPSTQHN